MKIVNVNLPVLADSREDSAGVRGPGDVAHPAVQVESHQRLSAVIYYRKLLYDGSVSKHRLQNI